MEIGGGGNFAGLGEGANRTAHVNAIYNCDEDGSIQRIDEGENFDRKTGAVTNVGVTASYIVRAELQEDLLDRRTMRVTAESETRIGPLGNGSSGYVSFRYRTRPTGGYHRTTGVVISSSAGATIRCVCR